MCLHACTCLQYVHICVHASTCMHVDIHGYDIGAYYNIVRSYFLPQMYSWWLFSYIVVGQCIPVLLSAGDLQSVSEPSFSTASYP